MNKEPAFLEFSGVSEARGQLNYLEGLKDIPFEVKRVYWLTQVPDQQVRGGHAHKTGEQVIVCTNGIIEAVLDDGKGRVLNYTLDNPNQGLYIPAMWWGKMLFSRGAQLLGLASDEFSEEDYIRNKEDFNGAV